MSRRSSSAAATTVTARKLGAYRDTPLRETGKWTTPTMRQPDLTGLSQTKRAEQVKERTENAHVGKRCASLPNHIAVCAICDCP